MLLCPRRKGIGLGASVGPSHDFCKDKTLSRNAREANFTRLVLHNNIILKASQTTNAISTDQADIFGLSKSLMLLARIWE